MVLVTIMALVDLHVDIDDPSMTIMASTAPVAPAFSTAAVVLVTFNDDPVPAAPQYGSMGAEMNNV